MYITQASKKSKCGKVRNLVDANTNFIGENEFGESVYKLPYSVNEQQNLRCNYSNSDIIAIPTEYNDCISVEDGYVLAWGDFAQSDFRIAYNLFIRNDANDKVMNSYEDKYEALARIVSATNGKPFDLDKFKEDRKLYKRLTLATMYGTSSSVVKEEADFITNFTRFLEMCPRYTEYKRRINDRLDINLPMYVEGYFGHVELVPQQYNRAHSIDKALNTPVQTGTSEIIILTVNRIIDDFRKLGYGPDDFSVYYVRHDEPIFKIKKTVLKDLWVLENASTVLVDEWIPLKLDFHYGYVYKEPDGDLEEAIKGIIESSSNKIDTFELESGEASFYPLPPVCKVHVDLKIVEDKSIITICVPEIKGAMYSLVRSNSTEQLGLFLRNKIEGLAESIYKKGYRGILVYSSFYEGESFKSDSFIRFSIKDTPDMCDSRILGNYAFNRYKKESGMEYSEISDDNQSVVDEYCNLEECLSNG